LSQPTLRRKGDTRLKGAASKKGKCTGVATNVYSRKMLEKPKRGLGILGEGVRELFTCGEGISTPHVRHKGQKPLIKCAKWWLQYLFIFPFLCFFIFWGRQERGLAPTYPQVQWGTQTYIVLLKQESCA